MGSLPPAILQSVKTEKVATPIQQQLKTPKSTISMSQESAQTNSKLPPALSGTNSFLARSTGVTTTTQDKGENTALTYVWCDTIHLSSISYSPLLSSIHNYIRHTRVHCCYFDNKIGMWDSHTSISFVSFNVHTIQPGCQQGRFREYPAHTQMYVPGAGAIHQHDTLIHSLVVIMLWFTQSFSLCLSVFCVCTFACRPFFCMMCARTQHYSNKIRD